MSKAEAIRKSFSDDWHFPKPDGDEVDALIRKIQVDGAVTALDVLASNKALVQCDESGESVSVFIGPLTFQFNVSDLVRAYADDDGAIAVDVECRPDPDLWQSL